jgi:tRNA-dihydrouridine synthase A
VTVPVTVKHRLGVDDDDPRTRLFSFVETQARAGTTHFIVHARKAWLSGLSPKENRQVPPLDYELVAELKRSHPDLTIILNGGLDLESASRELPRFDGVMLGRAAYETPSLLLEVDRRIFGEAAPVRSQHQAALDFRPYLVEHLSHGRALHAVTRHMLGLFAGMPGARAYRRVLSEKGPRAVGPGAIAVFEDAVAAVAQVQAVEPVPASAG